MKLFLSLLLCSFVSVSSAAQGRILSKYYGQQEWDSPEAKHAVARTLRLTP